MVTSSKKIPPVPIFQTVLLLFWPECPTRTIIPDRMFIPDSRVCYHPWQRKNEQHVQSCSTFLLHTLKITCYMPQLGVLWQVHIYSTSA